MRTRKALYNTIASMVSELVTLTCGLILPRLILDAFGSDYNGITSSITQFLSAVILLRSGVAGVTKAALYGPISKGDMDSVSAVVLATENFMRRIAVIYAVALVSFAAIYPLVVEEFDWFFSFSLVLIMGISTFVQYYFGISYQFLFQADQKHYVYIIGETAGTALNTVLAAILIRCGADIHMVKLGSALAFSINPLIICCYARRHYRIDRSVSPNMTAISQRWDAFAQTVAFFVHNNTDVIVLTVFSTLKEVSVYTIYHYVTANIANIMRIFVSSLGPAFGNMLARNEKKAIEENLRLFELIVFGLAGVLYTVAALLIIPFVQLYTRGIMDADYVRPVFSAILILAGVFHCFRIPYQAIAEAAGHFRQLRNGAIVEAAANIVLSVVLVIRYGLVGVAIGTILATFFRSIQYARYVSRYIVARPLGIFFGHIAIDIVVAITAIALAYFLLPAIRLTVWGWIFRAVVITILTATLSILAHLIFYHNDCLLLWRKCRQLLENRGTEKGR